MRATAASAFGLLGKEAVPWGADVAELLGDEDTTVVMAAVACVGRVGGCWAKHCLARLQAERPRERAAAAEALGLMGAKEHAKEVAELLQDSDWQAAATHTYRGT